ncbi:hypothetical protein JCM15519_01530 [Fundidesulfovibrio butyratiphilus]
MSEPRYYRAKQILSELLPIGKTKFYSLVKAGKFPRPHKLGPRVSLWSDDQVDAMRAFIEGEAF